MYQIGIGLLFQFICKSADVPTYADNATFCIVCLPSAKGAHDFRKEVPPPILSVVSKCALIREKRGFSVSESPRKKFTILYFTTAFLQKLRVKNPLHFQAQQI